jgi:hypothetical protein
LSIISIKIRKHIRDEVADADFNQQERIGLEHQLNHFVDEVSNSGDLKILQP